MDPRRTFSSSGHLPYTLDEDSSVSNVNSEKEQKKPTTGGVGLQGPGRRMRSSRLRTFSTPMQCQPEASSSQKESGASKQQPLSKKTRSTGAYLTSLLRNAQFR